MLTMFLWIVAGVIPGHLSYSNASSGPREVERGNCTRQQRSIHGEPPMTCAPGRFSQIRGHRAQVVKDKHCMKNRKDPTKPALSSAF